MVITPDVIMSFKGKYIFNHGINIHLKACCFTESSVLYQKQSHMQKAPFSHEEKYDVP